MTECKECKSNPEKCIENKKGFCQLEWIESTHEKTLDQINHFNCEKFKMGDMDHAIDTSTMES